MEYLKSIATAKHRSGKLAKIIPIAKAPHSCQALGPARRPVEAVAPGANGGNNHPGSSNNEELKSISLGDVDIMIITCQARRETYG